LKIVSYEDLKSGLIDLNGKETPTSSLSSFHVAREVAKDLAEQIEKGEFLLEPGGGAALAHRQFPAHEADEGVAKRG